MPFEPPGIDPAVASGPLTRDQILHLAQGRIAAIHVRRALAAEKCAALARLLDSVSLTDYDIRKYRLPAAHLGPSLNEAKVAGEIDPGYWERRDHTGKFWGESADDPRPDCLALLAAAWPYDVGPATVDGRELFWGIIREINQGTVVHCDDVLKEYPPSLLDHPPVAQLGFNLFLSAPDAGGETLVWDRRWTAEDEKHRRGIGYSRRIVGNDVPVAVTPATGDVIIFDSRNFHAVRPGRGRRRITLSFFMGLTDDERLILWS